MTPELWQRMKPIFHAALDLDPAERDSYLHAACGTDQALRLRVTELLEVDREVGSIAEDATSVDSPGSSPAPSANSDPRFRPGALVLNRFRILRSLGEGGMGEVYEAEDLELGKVALKTIRAGMVRSPEMVERFRREVQLARKVSGPQVCRVYELFVLPVAGRFPETAFLTMEFIAGETLARKLARDGPMQPGEALQVARDLCEGLRLIHAQGIVHRDLKCSNIMLAHDGPRTRTVLMDFGLAHDSDAHQRNSNASTAANVVDAGYGGTVAGTMLGTPNYMAPEQFEGRDVSPATDIYALGIVLYELVTGIQPFAAHTPVAAAIRRSRRPAPASSLMRSLPRRWDRIIERCLAYDPADRFESTAEVLKALEGGSLDLKHLRKDRPWLAAAALAASLALLIAFGIWLWQDLQIYRPDAAAKRPFDEGVAALDEGNYIKATRLLEAALAKDPHFVMAHVRLAEAWSGLDFQGNAQRELLLAAPDERRLNSLDRLYLQAIRAGVTGDFAAAARIDEEILSRLHGKNLPAAYVDLGWACERSGDPARALATYRKALDLDKDWPAAWMKIAILEGRQHHQKEADEAFQHADEIFTREVNPEGLAELDYERGYAANDRGAYQVGERYLTKALAESEQISAKQLQIRVLGQLSGSVLYSDTPKAIKYAQQAIDLARANALDTWAATGLIRLGSAHFIQGDLTQAQALVEQGLDLALQTEQRRVEALGNVMLASIRLAEEQFDQVTGPASEALQYYRANAFFAPAASASQLLISADRDLGHLSQAFEAASSLLEIAQESGDLNLLHQAHELVGSVLLDMERLPDALGHFLAARDLADGPAAQSWDAFASGQVLWRLGDTRTAEHEFAIAAQTRTLLPLIVLEHVHMLVCERRFREALTLVASQRNHLRTLPKSDLEELSADEAVSEAASGLRATAISRIGELINDAHHENEVLAAPNYIAVAYADLALQSWAQAAQAAQLAAAYFQHLGMPASELRALLVATLAAEQQGDSFTSFETRRNALDTIRRIKETWGSPAKNFFSRPDVSFLLKAEHIDVS